MTHETTNRRPVSPNPVFRAQLRRLDLTSGRTEMIRLDREIDGEWETVAFYDRDEAYAVADALVGGLEAASGITPATGRVA